MSNEKSPNYALRRAGAAIVLGGVVVAGAFGIKSAMHKHESAEKTGAEITKWSQLHLAESYTDHANPLSKDKSVFLYKLTEEDDSANRLAVKLGAHDWDVVSGEIAGQTGKYLNPGETIVLPLSQVDTDAIGLDIDRLDEAGFEPGPPTEGGTELTLDLLKYTPYMVPDTEDRLPKVA